MDLYYPQLSPTCKEALTYLQNNPEDCLTTHELTKISGIHQSNWASIKKCMGQMKKRGYVHRKKKCVHHADCYEAHTSEQKEHLDGNDFAHPKDVSPIESNALHTDFHLQRYEMHLGAFDFMTSDNVRFKPVNYASLISTNPFPKFSSLSGFLEENRGAKINRAQCLVDFPQSLFCDFHRALS